MKNVPGKKTSLLLNEGLQFFMPSKVLYVKKKVE